MKFPGGKKLVILLGSLAGAAMSITITLLMDTLYGDSLGGTWNDAIVGDLQRYFSMNVSADSLIVTVVFLCVLLILGAFGGFMGFIFTTLFVKFMDFLHVK